MNVVTRGIRNAFRNTIRSLSIVTILGLSLGLSLTMLVAYKAVGNKIADVKSSIGNTITISPAGFNPGSSANNALTTSQLSKVRQLAHISNVTEQLNDHLQTTGTTSTPQAPAGALTQSAGPASSGATTSLKSPLKINTNGSGSDDGPRLFMSGGSATLPSNFSLPVTFLGTTDPDNINNSTITIKSGTAINSTKDTNSAMISQAMASKNNLKVGSMFKAYDKNLTVAAIFSSSTKRADDTVVVSLTTLQRLSGQTGVVTDATATVDSVDNLSTATNAIKSTLGSSADVTNSQSQVDDAVKPLNSVRTVSLFSLIGAVVAGAVIILLVMIMVVRERKREIGVVKAIGGSNLRIMSEFMIEALTLTLVGAAIGLVLGVVAGQPVTNMLVNNSVSSSDNTSQLPSGKLSQAGGPITVSNGPGGFSRSFRNNAAVKGLSNVNAQIGWGILLDGFGAAVLIAVVGSALASGMIAKVRPSEVLRSE